MEFSKRSRQKQVLFIHKGESVKGHITIYFSLLLVVMFSLLCTTIESARLSGVRVRCQSSAYLGLESVFADYSLPVAREYGLLMLDKSYGTDNPEEYLLYLKNYISYNASVNKELLVKGSDFCQAQVENVSLKKEQIIAGEGGVPLEKEILEYMKYAMPAGLVEWILGQLGLLEQAEIVTTIFEKLSGLCTYAEKVDLAIHRMHRGINQVKEYQFNIEEAAGYIKGSIDELDELYKEYEETKEEEEIEQIEKEIHILERSIALNVQDLVQNHTTLLEYNNYVAGQKKQYSENTQLVKEMLVEMEQLFEEGKEKLDKEIKEIVDTELSNIRLYSAGEGDYYRVVDGTQDLAPNISILESNISQLSPYMSGGTGGLSSVLDSCISAMGSYRIDRMGLNYKDQAASGKGKVDIITFIRQLLGSGLLGLVAENVGELSNMELILDKVYEDILKGYPYGQEDIIRQILINEYLLNRFGNLQEPAKDKLVSYELEYILAGKESDRQNLASVAAELLMLRSGMNFIYLLGNEQKRAEAEGLAILLAGFTGMQGIIKITQLLILSVWAQAEGIADVRELFAGKRVPFTKEDRTWKVSFTNLIKQNISDLFPITEEGEGLTYQDYLRLLLLKAQRPERNGRVMDLIEGVIRKEYDKGFSLQECVTELVVYAEFKAKPLFVMLPFIKGNTKEYYQIKGISSYSY